MRNIGRIKDRPLHEVLFRARDNDTVIVEWHVFEATPGGGMTNKMDWISVSSDVILKLANDLKEGLEKK